MELDADETHWSTAERAHGGVLFTMLDTALGRAVISVLPDGQGCATVECKINFFRPVVRGRIVAEAAGGDEDAADGLRRGPRSRTKRAG